MKRTNKRQYTIRRVPLAVDRVLRERARRERRSLNDVALEALRHAAELPEPPAVFTDLDDCIGTWEDDPAFDAALAAQDTVDESLWR